VVLGTGGLGIIAMGATTSGIELRSDPDWEETAVEFQVDCQRRENRVQVAIRRAIIPLSELQSRSLVADLYRRRETVTWLTSEQYEVITSLSEVLAAT
jgi:hypothetical protein